MLQGSASASATAPLATPKAPQPLARIWLRAEITRELVIAGADRRSAADWRLLRELCGETHTRLTLVVERRPTDDQLAALGEATCGS